MVFSPYEALSCENLVDVGCSITDFLKLAVETEARRDEEAADDAEGWPLRYAPYLDSIPSSSSLSSPSPSPSPPPPSPPPVPSPSRSAPSLGLKHPAHTQAAVALVDTNSTSEPGKSHCKHKQAGYYARRRRKREEAKNTDCPLPRKIRSSQSKKYQDLYTVKSKFNVCKLPASSVGFIGKRLDVTPGQKSLADCVQEGFKVVQWSGE